MQESYEETLTGVGPWRGRVNGTLEVVERGPRASDASDRRFESRLCAQLERYDWFAGRIDGPRSVGACLRALHARPRRPGQRELALVELSLHGTRMARAALESWSPPEGQSRLALFYEVCRVCAPRPPSAP
jgi:hypothetical protein